MTGGQALPDCVPPLRLSASSTQLFLSLGRRPLLQGVQPLPDAARLSKLLLIRTAVISEGSREAGEAGWSSGLTGTLHSVNRSPPAAATAESSCPLSPGASPWFAYHMYRRAEMWEGGGLQTRKVRHPHFPLDLEARLKAKGLSGPCFLHPSGTVVYATFKHFSLQVSPPVRVAPSFVALAADSKQFTGKERKREGIEST